MTLTDAPKNEPYTLFEDWFLEAQKNDPVYYCGMNIATVDAKGQPSLRVVLLKSFDQEGFVFFTNYQSQKGQELDNNAAICANFWWSDVQRQIRISGNVEKVSEKQSDDYFKSRPKGSQLAAIASQQSQPIESLSALKEHYEMVVSEHQSKPIERPKHWGGYRIKPQRIEFWQGLEHRLHHRLLYTWSESRWTTQFLQP